MKQHLYYEALDWRSYFKYFFRQDKKLFLNAFRKNFSSENIYLTRAGRTGIILSLKAFGLKREDQVLVPRFMSTCVLDAVNQVAMPSLDLTERTKAVLFYHHWGYAQNYAKAQSYIASRKLWVIEDCAHGVWGSSQGHTLGDFGHTAIFSLSKILEMTYAGALKINDPSLSEKIQGYLNENVSWKNILESFKGELDYLFFYNSPLRMRADKDLEASLLKWYATLLTYPQLTTLRGPLPRFPEEFQKVFLRQNSHFTSMLKTAKSTAFMLSEDKPEAMAPLCFPIFSQDLDLLKTMENWLKQRNIFVSIYNFDVNRCMFESNYQKCLPLPLYASLDDKLYQDFQREFKGNY